MKKHKLKLKFGEKRTIRILPPKGHKFPITKKCDIKDSIICPFCETGFPTKEVVRKDGKK